MSSTKPAGGGEDIVTVTRRLLEFIEDQEDRRAIREIAHRAVVRSATIDASFANWNDRSIPVPTSHKPTVEIHEYEWLNAEITELRERDTGACITAASEQVIDPRRFR